MRPVSRLILATTMFGLIGAGVVATTGSTSGASTANGCGPGTYDDTDKVVKTIDDTIDKTLKIINAAIDLKVLAPGDTLIRYSTAASGLLQRDTITRSADGTTYSFQRELAQPSATPNYVVINTGSRTNAGTVGTVHTVNKLVTADYDALRALLPTSKATGSFAASEIMVTDTAQAAPGKQTTLNVDFAGITVSSHDTHGARTGTYVHVGEPTIGGSLDFHGTIPVPCPADPSMGSVDVTVQRQYIDDATGERFFRRDAVATGGSLAPGEQAIAFVCGTEPVKGSGTRPSSYSLGKIENADGSTQRYHIKLKNETGPNCNSQFASLVAPTNNASDWAFTHPVVFPGEW